MKNYAVVADAHELRRKLESFVRHRAERYEHDASSRTKKKDKDAMQQRAYAMRELETFLTTLVVCEAAPADAITGFFI